MKFDVDAIIVLGASLSAEDNTKASPQTIKNLEKFKNLQFEGPVVLSGGFYKANKNKTEASVMNDLMHDWLGDAWLVKEKYIEDKSNNSGDNIRFSLDIIQREIKDVVVKTIAIIDQPTHRVQIELLWKNSIRTRQRKVVLKFISAEPIWGNNVKWWQYQNRLVYSVYQILSTCYYILKRKITLRDII